MSEETNEAGLIDVSTIDLTELLTELDESSLRRTVKQILTTSEDNICHSFSSSI